jgi:uncharacterized Zn-binding protein involved in type VI secretion
MALLGIARLGDTTSGFCSAHPGGRNWTGVITSVSAGFTVDGIQAATIDDTGTCDCGHNFKISAGSGVTTAPNGKRVARVTDAVVVYNGLTPVGSGTITTGSVVVKSE